MSLFLNTFKCFLKTCLEITYLMYMYMSLFLNIFKCFLKTCLEITYLMYMYMSLFLNIFKCFLKTCLEITYLMYMYKKALALNKLPCLVCHKTKPLELNGVLMLN